MSCWGTYLTCVGGDGKVAGYYFDSQVASTILRNSTDKNQNPLPVAQLLGLLCSLRLGLKPDNPSPNGTISRVVSHVNIYR